MAPLNEHQKLPGGTGALPAPLLPLPHPPHPPHPPTPPLPPLSTHQLPGGTKLSGVRGSVWLDKMLQNDRDNNDNFMSPSHGAGDA